MMAYRYNPNNSKHRRVSDAILKHLPTTFKSIIQILIESGLDARIHSYDYTLTVEFLNELVKKGKLVAKYEHINRLFCLSACTNEKGEDRRTRTVVKKETSDTIDYEEYIKKRVEEEVKKILSTTPNTATLDEITYEELNEIRRKEENSTYISKIRSDFYKATSQLLSKNKERRNKILVENPELYDSISGRYKNIEMIVERIKIVRLTKIQNSALRDATAGGSYIPENAIEEEKAHYNKVFASCKDILKEVSQ